MGSPGPIWREGTIVMFTSILYITFQLALELSTIQPLEFFTSSKVMSPGRKRAMMDNSLPLLTTIAKALRTQTRKQN